MILSAQSIRSRCLRKQRGGVFLEEWSSSMITPFVERSVEERTGKSFGLSSAGYDIRVDKFRINGSKDPVDHVRMQNGDFVLASSIERIKMPKDLLCIVHDKSSWAREGLALQNTVLEPGWEGYITLELSYHRPAHHVIIKHGDPIAQLIFHKLDATTEQPYKGKYQNQAAEPVESIKESTTPAYVNEATGLVCSVCGKPQFNSPSGITCINGHGGAESRMP